MARQPGLRYFRIPAYCFIAVRIAAEQAHPPAFRTQSLHVDLAEDHAAGLIAFGQSAPFHRSGYGRCIRRRSSTRLRRRPCIYSRMTSLADWPDIRPRRYSSLATTRRWRKG